MLEVHPPHKAIHGVGEFFLHLFTITVGLLIAVGIEEAVTRHGHHELAHEAHATMTAEIRHNQEKIAGQLREIAGERERLRATLAAIARVQLNPRGPDADKTKLNINFIMTSLDQTAWRAAGATGALSYMEYDEAQKFSTIYDDVATFEKVQLQWLEDEATFIGLIRRYMPKEGRLSKEGADAMAQELGVWQGHLLNMSMAARLLQEDQAVFLERREPKRDLTEELSN